MKRTLLFFVFLGLAWTSYAQNQQERTVTGVVTTAVDDAPLAGVTVMVKNTTRGVISGLDGTYSIQVADGETLVFRYIGFVSIEIPVEGQSNISVSMREDFTQLEDVIVTAFGSINREEFVGSAVQISARQLEQRSITSATQAVEGASAGVLISPGSGQPGSSPSIRVRGIGSVSSSNAPLLVVDGSIFSGELASINPNDIETITVLKDAASTSLYGSGAANGVIMITTKSGRSLSGTAREQINVRMSQGVTSRSIPEYDRVDAMQYAPLIWESYRNSLSMSGDLSMEDASQRATDDLFSLIRYNPYGVPNNNIVGTNGQLNPGASLLWNDDWQEEITRVGARSNFDMSYSGLAGNTDYFASFGYLDETGYVVNSDFERYNARLNINSRLRDWMKVGINTAVALGESNQAVDGVSSNTSFVNPYRSTRLMGPIYPLFVRDPITGERVAGTTYDPGDTRPEQTGRNVVQENLLNSELAKNTNLNLRGYGEFYFLNDFTLTLNAAVDRRQLNVDRYRNPIIGDAAPGGDAYREAIMFNGLTLSQLLNYRKNFGRHNVNVLLGHESFQYERNYMFTRRGGEVTDGNNELINYVDLLAGTSNTREYRKEGYFTRINYDLDSKYFISASLRRDASSRFNSDVRWNNFWSVGLAWRLDQEDFIRSLSWVNSLKLRGSYGQVGNDSNLSHASLSFYAYQALYQLGYNNATEAGILLSTAGNPNLQWESNDQTDVAVEFELFDSRFIGTLEYYNRETADLIFDVPLPRSSGLDSYPDNIGTMFNRGLELTVGADIVRNRDMVWNVTVNASTLRNEFKELPQEEIITGTKKLVVGGSIYDYWLRQWYGVDPADGSALYVASQEAIDANGADIRQIDGQFLTTNHNNAEYGFVGTAIPDLFGSFSSTLSYKGFSLSALFTYQVGGKTYDSNYALLMHPGSDYGRAMSTDILNRWQQPGDITDVPRLDANQAAAFNAASSRWLVDSDYLALRNVNLSYQLPRTFTTQYGISRATVYANAENLFQRTARTGLEAAQQFNGTTQNRYTPSRVFTAGINLTF
ncbi:MAG: SusC family TonB-dependent receptor [Bacteroidetes bacterium HLUCCA01]|nr:MAG: SusC family TonB-dependent receptor [Bacteroidetes bacterium HLUCCA01]